MPSCEQKKPSEGLIVVQKPEHGSPCNGCGWCCQQEVCQLGLEFIRILPAVTPCPALEVENGRAFCGLVRRPAFYMFGEDVPESQTGWISSQFAAALGFGHGCDSP